MGRWRKSGLHELGGGFKNVTIREALREASAKQQGRFLAAQSPSPPPLRPSIIVVSSPSPASPASSASICIATPIWTVCEQVWRQARGVRHGAPRHRKRSTPSTGPYRRGASVRLLLHRPPPSTLSRARLRTSSAALGTRRQGALVRRATSPPCRNLGAEAVRSREGCLGVERALQARAREGRHGYGHARCEGDAGRPLAPERRYDTPRAHRRAGEGRDARQSRLRR